MTRVRRVPSANASTRVRLDDRRVQEAHERAGVRLHRAAHVEQQDERRRCRSPGSRNARSTGSPPARSERRTVRRRSGVPRACARAAAPRTARRAPAKPQIGHQPARLGELGRRVRREVAVAQHLRRAPAHRDHGRVGAGPSSPVGASSSALGVEREDDLLDRRARERRARVVPPTRTRRTRGRTRRCPRAASPASPGRPSTRRRGRRSPTHASACANAMRRTRPGRRGPRRGARARERDRERAPGSGRRRVDAHLRHCAPPRRARARRARARARAPDPRGTSGSCRA